MWLIAGLGNPGPAYEGTRHNIGFLVVEELACRGGMKLRRKRKGGLYAAGALEGEEVVLLKPQTFMNCSGNSVAPWLLHLHLSPSRLIVIHDDLDLPVSSIRIKKGGGHGGHRGILSIMRELGSRDFIRIKMGIGRPREEMDPVDHVLEPFSEEEQEEVLQAIARASEAALMVVGGGLEAAMNRFNRRSKRAFPLTADAGEVDADETRGEVRAI